MTRPFPSILCFPLTWYCTIWYCRERHRLEPLTEIGPSTPDAAGHCPEPCHLIGSGHLTVLLRILPTTRSTCFTGAPCPPASCITSPGPSLPCASSLPDPGASWPPAETCSVSGSVLPGRLILLRGQLRPLPRLLDVVSLRTRRTLHTPAAECLPQRSQFFFVNGDTGWLQAMLGLCPFMDSRGWLVRHGPRTTNHISRGGADRLRRGTPRWSSASCTAVGEHDDAITSPATALAVDELRPLPAHRAGPPRQSEVAPAARRAGRRRETGLEHLRRALGHGHRGRGAPRCFPVRSIPVIGSAVDRLGRGSGGAD
jgi:hypothetical protein